MKILIIEPYFTGSHKAWAEGYAQHSEHDVRILSLPGNFWKWRMHGGAVTLAKQFQSLDFKPGILFATDMLDLTTFLSLTRNKSTGIPTAVYFHENQLSYPWSPNDRDILQKRDKHYGFINYVTALTADAVFFNSDYHKNSFLTELTPFLKHFPDHRDLENIRVIDEKSQVLPLGLALSRFDAPKIEKRKSKTGERPLIVWNHRWEFDKNPKEFFEALYRLAEKGLEFDVAILGKCFSQKPVEFENAQEKLGSRIVQFGYAEDFSEYAKWLWRADILPVTSIQDFFGASVVEAIYCGCFPILPDRLAYPELIPEAVHSSYFYHNFEDLVERLENAMVNREDLAAKRLRSEVEKFDWKVMAPVYDNELAKMAG